MAAATSRCTVSLSTETSEAIAVNKAVARRLYEEVITQGQPEVLWEIVAVDAGPDLH